MCALVVNEETTIDTDKMVYCAAIEKITMCVRRSSSSQYNKHLLQTI